MLLLYPVKKSIEVYFPNSLAAKGESKILTPSSFFTDPKALNLSLLVDENKHNPLHSKGNHLQNKKTTY